MTTKKRRPMIRRCPLRNGSWGDVIDGRSATQNRHRSPRLKMTGQSRTRGSLGRLLEPSRLITQPCHPRPAKSSLPRPSTGTPRSGTSARSNSPPPPAPGTSPAPLPLRRQRPRVTTSWISASDLGSRVGFHPQRIPVTTLSHGRNQCDAVTAVILLPPGRDPHPGPARVLPRGRGIVAPPSLPKGGAEQVMTELPTEAAQWEITALTETVRGEPESWPTPDGRRLQVPRGPLPRIRARAVGPGADSSRSPSVQ